MREEKKLFLEDLTDKIRGSKGFIVTQYQGFSAARSRDFRHHLAHMGADVEVVKKRVFIKAAQSLGIQFDECGFTGHVAVVFAYDDPAATVKGTIKYGEDNGNVVLPLGGHIEGTLCSREDIVAIAKLPALPQLRAQLLGLLQAPLSQTLGVLQAVLASPLYCLEEKSKQG